MAALKAILGDKVYGKDKSEVDVESFGSLKAVGLYFSAHWCPPCRGFTPVLADAYTKSLKAKGFEVVFISSDRDQASFDEYYAEMPWLTIGFGSEKKTELCSKYGVNGIPCLILLNPANGEIITKDGRSAVMSDTDGNNFPWTS